MWIYYEITKYFLRSTDNRLVVHNKNFLNELNGKNYVLIDDDYL